ncbi:hypothetical protein HYV43_05215 [Candidatus Micrarchaeota archaeon]|nr:hypothetical protein [Candidatus Micrarchaeota archaeon]
MAKRLPILKSTDSVKRKAAFASQFAGNTDRRYKYLRFIEREFDFATWKAQAHMMKALAGVARSYPRHSQRILQFLGARMRAEHFATAMRPRGDDAPHSSGARGYVPKVLRKIILTGRGDEVLRFVRRKYDEADDQGRKLLLHALEPLATAKHREHADALLRLAAHFLHQEPTAHHHAWVGLGVRASGQANARAAIEFFKTAYEYAPPEEREKIHRGLLDRSSTSSVRHVMEAAVHLAHEKDNWTRARMALLLNAVIVHAREWKDEGLAQEAAAEQRRIQLTGKATERQRRRQGRGKLESDLENHDLGT